MPTITLNLSPRLLAWLEATAARYNAEDQPAEGRTIGGITFPPIKHTPSSVAVALLELEILSRIAREEGG